MDEGPIDLTPMLGPDLDDQVRPAMRRFRWRVVAVTLLVVALVAGGSAYVTGSIVERRQRLESLIEVQQLPAFSTWVASQHCKTPTYRVGNTEVTLLGLTRHATPVEIREPVDMRNDGWSFHVLVETHNIEEVPIVGPDWDGRRMTVAAIDDRELRDLSTVGSPTAPIGEIYGTADGGVGEVLELELVGAHGDPIGRFRLDTGDLTCSEAT